MPALKRIEVRIQEDENGAALREILRQRPKLEIDETLTRSRNYGGL